MWSRAQIWQPFIDAKTESKVVLVRNKSDVEGEFGAGSANDAKLRALVGDDWRALCGVDEVGAVPAGSAYGFEQPAYWAGVLEEQAQWAASVRAAGGGDADIEDSKSGAEGSCGDGASGAEIAPPLPPR